MRVPPRACVGSRRTVLLPAQSKRCCADRCSPSRRVAQELGEAGDKCWESIIRKDVIGLGQSMKETFLAWRKMLPFTVPDWVLQEMETNYFPYYPGAITSGSGGGYVMVASETEIPRALKIKVKF